ncbi:MAG: cation diffusion facilitator family transporter [Saprospiraceae bacterium]
MEYSNPRGRNLLIVSLIVSIALLVLKFWAWALTHSNTIMTDALESIVNVIAGGLVLFSYLYAQRPKDRNHPNGHGKIEFLSAGIEGGLILFAGISIIGKAIYNYYYPVALEKLDFGIGLIFLTGLINYILGHFLFRQGQKENSLSMLANSEHLKSDAYSSFAMVLGLGLIYFSQLDWIDNLMAIAFGVIILLTGYRLIRKAIAGVMDETDPKLVQEIIAKIEQQRQENWVDMHNFRLIQYGTDLHIDCHLTLPWYFDTRSSHDEVKQFEELVENICERPVELFIHVDPCEHFSCKLCQKNNCSQRLHAAEKRISWTVENVIANEKHL